MNQLDQGGKGKPSVRRVRYLPSSSGLPGKVCRVGSEAGCSSLIYSGEKVEIYIHIRLHCGVLHVRDTDSPGMEIRASTRGQFELTSPRGQVKVVRRLVPLVQPIGTRETARPWPFQDTHTDLGFPHPLGAV